MNTTYEIKIYDSCEQLPTNCWKKDSIIEFEKTFAVKWFLILSYDKNTIIGSLLILRNPDDISNWYICNLHTLAEYRRMGVATKMYNAALDIIKEFYLASTITASISADNTASICLHNKLGFRNTSKASEFADFCFEADETMYSLWLAERYPAKSVPIHLDILQPMWISYMNEIGEHDSEEELAKGLQARIRLSENQEHIFFDIIWSGDESIGFAFYSVDGGIRNLIPAGYGYIMEFYLLEHWRKRGIGANIVTDICNKLKGLDCPKVYLTTVLQSERFWTNAGFNNSGLVDPDNELPIFIKDL